MISMDDIVVETFTLPDGDKITLVRHLPSGKHQIIDAPATDKDIAKAVARIAHSLPYYGDPGDESDHERWEGEGGSFV